MFCHYEVRLALSSGQPLIDYYCCDVVAVVAVAVVTVVAFVAVVALIAVAVTSCGRSEK